MEPLIEKILMLILRIGQRHMKSFKSKERLKEEGSEEFF
jgi:hypothetical protein